METNKFWKFILGIYTSACVCMCVSALAHVVTRSSGIRWQRTCLCLLVE